MHQLIPLWKRYIDQWLLPLVGVGVILFPGFLVFNWISIKQRKWGILAGSLWLLGYLLIYAWRLPVTYQHGRYIMPAMPVYFLWSLAGISSFIIGSREKTWERILGRTWVLSSLVVLVLFWFQGMRAYSQDVAIIQTEMVATARWINSNTPVDGLVAAHDIGALGYFGKRQIIDLAGLVSPEVIPFIRDEARIRGFLEGEGADYLVTFPGWYPNLVQGLEPMYNSAAPYSPAAGGENMCVYRW